MDALARIRKAIVAGIGTSTMVATTLGVTGNLADVDPLKVVAIVAAGVVVAIATWLFPNKAPAV